MVLEGVFQSFILFKLNSFLVALRLLSWFACPIGIVMDGVHFILWVAMSIYTMTCIKEHISLDKNLHNQDKVMAMQLALATLPLMYEFNMIKYLHSNAVGCLHLDTLQVVGVFPAITLLLQTCFQFALPLSRVEELEHNISRELQSSSRYIKEYNLFMLFHLFSVQLMSLKTDGWMTDIFFLGSFELAARVWGVHLFQSISNLNTGPSEVVALDNSDMTLEASYEIMVPEETVSDLHKNVEWIICNRIWESRGNFTELSKYLDISDMTLEASYEIMVPEETMSDPLHKNVEWVIFNRIWESRGNFTELSKYLDISDMTLEASYEIMVPEETMSDPLHKNVEWVIFNRIWDNQESRDNYKYIYGTKYIYLATVPVNYMYEDLIPETVFANHKNFSRFVLSRAP